MSGKTCMCVHLRHATAFRSRQSIIMTMSSTVYDVFRHFHKHFQLVTVPYLYSVLCKSSFSGCNLIDIYIMILLPVFLRHGLAVVVILLIRIYYVPLDRHVSLLHNCTFVRLLRLVFFQSSSNHFSKGVNAPLHLPSGAIDTF